MKKSIFYYLCAVMCTVCLFTACSDDDDDDKKGLTTANIAGTYNGTMDISVAGAKVADDLTTSITVTAVNDNSVKVSLKNFTIPNLLPIPMNIEATCTTTAVSDELKLNGTTQIDLSTLGMGNLNVNVTGEADGRELDLDITVPNMGVAVDFEGTK